MDNTMFMGFLIIALATLLTIASIITAIIVKPIINLKTEIAGLRNSCDTLSNMVGKVEQRIEKHGKEIDDMNKDLKTFEGRISKIEGQMK